MATAVLTVEPAELVHVGDSEKEDAPAARGECPATLNPRPTRVVACLNQ